MTRVPKWPYYHISVLTNLIYFAVSKIIWDYPNLGLFRVIATARCCNATVNVKRGLTELQLVD